MVVGDIELHPLRDAVGRLGEYTELFPKTSGWADYEDVYPELYDGSSWRLPCGSYLLRTEEATILVDTAVGPPGLWEWDAESEGMLPDGLSEVGVTPEDVDLVFLTHLHIDHLGWNTDRDGHPMFPNARYLTHRDGLAFVREGGRPHVSRTIQPVTFEELDDETELAPGITAFPLPGHFPGHMGVRVQSGGERAVLCADFAVHPLLLDRPGDVYESDLDQWGSAARREALVPTLVDQDILVVCGHYPNGGIGRVVRRDGRVLWTPV